MKQRIRRIWLALCMAVCLFALAGCSAAADTAETIDPQIEMAMQSGSQQYLDLFNQMDDASIEQALATSVKNKDTVMENALKSWDSIKDDLGAFVSSETAVVTKGDDGYIARMNTVYEKRAMEFTLIADEDLSKVETISFSPVYTTGEKMAKAGMNPKTLQYLMGHSDSGVTMNTYTHLGLEDAKDEMIRMEELNAAKRELEKTTGEKPVTQKMFRVV